MKILFIGNSHTYVNHMCEIVRKNSLENIEVSMIARGGITLQDHLNDPSVEFALKQDFDIVVFQQAAHIPCPSKEETLTCAKKIVELCRINGKIPYVLIPWAERDHDEHFEIIQDIYETLMQDEHVDGINAGIVIDYLNHHSDINCYLQDNQHMNMYGSYVEACCVLNMLFNQTTFKGITCKHGSFDPIVLEESIHKQLDEAVVLIHEQHKKRHCVCQC